MSTFDAGSIEVTATLDRSPLRRGIADAKQDLRDFERTSAKVSLDADPTKFNNAMRKARAQGLDFAKGKLQVTVDADTAPFQTKAMLVQSVKNALARKVNVDVDVDAAGAAAKLAVVDAGVKKVDSTAKKAADKGGGIPLMASAIGILAATAVPLGAVLGGAIGATALAAGSLALGVYGAVQAVKAGTDAGFHFVGIMGEAKGILQGLSTVAAGRILQPFDEIVQDTYNHAMQLTVQTAKFATISGNVVVPVVHTLFGALNDLDPLFTRLGAGAVTLATKLETWGDGGGFKRFGDYALSVLPQVSHAVGEIATAIGHLVTGLGPLGLSFLTGFGRIAALINAIPIGVLQQLLPLLTSIYIAVKAYEGLSAASDSLGKFTTKLTGAATAATAASTATAASGTGASEAGALAAGGAAGFSVLGAALVGVSVVVGLATMAWTNHQQKVAANNSAVSSLTQALIASNGAITANIRQNAALALIQSGAAKTAAKYGIDIDTLTSASLGNAAANLKVNEVLSSNVDSQKKYGVSTNQMTKDAGKISDALGKQTTQLTAAQEEYQKLNAATQAAAEAKDPEYQSYARVAGILGTTVPLLQAVKTNIDNKKASDAAATLQMQAEGDAAGLLGQALDRLNGKALSNADAQIAFKQTLTSLGSQLVTNTDGLQGNTDASVSNEAAINASIHAIEAAGQARSDSTGDEKQGIQVIKDSRQALIDKYTAERGGSIAARAEVTKYVDGLLKIPTSLPPLVPSLDDSLAQAKIAALKTGIDNLKQNKVPGVDVNTEAGKDQLAALQRQLDQLTGKDILIKVALQTTGIIGEHSGLASANGNMIKAYASGGMESHQPQIANTRPGTVRVWAEPETRGESYIPHANDARRPRAHAIMAKTAALLGGVYSYAKGGIQRFATGGTMADGWSSNLTSLWNTGKVGADVINQLRIQNMTLGRMIDTQAAYTQTLQNATNQLVSDTQARDSTRAGARNATTGTFNIATDGNGSQYGILQTLKNRVASAQQFSGLYGKAAGLGLNADFLQTLADNPGTAGANLQAIVAGGKGYVSQLNQQYALLGASGTAIGNTLTKANGQDATLVRDTAAIAASNRQVAAQTALVAANTASIDAQISALQAAITAAAKKK